MRNFLTILKRYKTSSILNILGLAVAFASLYIILVQVHYDLTYNKAIPDCERVYQVELFDDYSGKYSAWMSRPMAEAFMRDCPVIEKYGTGYIGDMENIAYDCCMDKEGSLAEFRVGMGRISTQWLDVFGYRAVSGSFSELEKPKSIAVSQNIAKKLGLKVGDHIYNGLKVDPNKMSMVVAIYNDLPVQNTDLNNIDMVWNLGNQSMDSWSEWSYNYWIKLRSTADVQAFYDYANKKYREILAQEGKSEEEIAKAIEETKLRIIPITDTYFATDSEVPGRSGNKTTTFTLLSIAILVVLIALINFINFFFALVPVRIRSVNTRKVFGCSAARLRADFILESIGIIIISLLLSWACVDIIKSSTIANYIGAPLNLSK
ncbi:MAG: ABC transporter permease, partial [Bacteroidales bacterium]